MMKPIGPLQTLLINLKPLNPCSRTYNRTKKKNAVQAIVNSNASAFENNKAPPAINNKCLKIHHWIIKTKRSIIKEAEKIDCQIENNN